MGSRKTGGGVGRDRALVEHWDGQQWRAVAIPDPAGSESLTEVAAVMNSVAAVASDDVWAVGWMISTSIIQHWERLALERRAEPLGAQADLGQTRA